MPFPRLDYLSIITKMELLIAFIENGTQETTGNGKINIRKIKLHCYIFFSALESDLLVL